MCETLDGVSERRGCAILRPPRENSVSFALAWVLGSIDWAASLNSAANPWSAIMFGSNLVKVTNPHTAFNSEATPGVFVDDL